MNKVEFSNATVIVIGDAEEINYEHQLFIDSLKTGLEHAIKCGELLIKKKDDLAHGDWMPWVKGNCDFTDRMASNYMRLASNRKRVSDLNNIDTIRAALALLAEPDEKNEKDEIESDWSKDTRVKAMLKGMDDVRRGLLILGATDRDPIGRKYYLDMMEQSLDKALKSVREYRQKYHVS